MSSASPVHCGGVSPSFTYGRRMHPIVKVALAAIAAFSALTVMTAFPPAIMLVGGCVILALFASCLGSRGHHQTYPRRGVTVLHTSPPAYPPPSPEVGGHRYVHSVRGRGRGHVYSRVVDATRTSPTTAAGVGPSGRFGPLSRAENRASSSRRSSAFGGSVGGFGTFRGPGSGGPPRGGGRFSSSLGALDLRNNRS